MDSILSGGMAGLVVCLFAKFQEWRDGQNERRQVKLIHHSIIVEFYIHNSLSLGSSRSRTA